MFCISTVLPVRGGATINARWPLPIGATMSITLAERSFLVGSSNSSRNRWSGNSGVKLSKLTLRFDFQQRKIAFAFLGAADVAFDGIAGAKPEAADLRGRNIDIIGSRQIIGVRRAQESESVGENLNDAFADNVGFLDRELFENCEHQLLLAHGAGIFDPFFFRKRYELGWRLGFEVLKFHFPHGGGPVE